MQALKTALAVTLTAWAVACLLPASASAQRPVVLKAVMILASDTRPAPIDERIENVEFKLRRIFKFEHYHHYGEGSVSLNLPGSGRIPLGKGYALEIDAKDAGDGKVRAHVKWQKGETVLLNTSTLVSRGTPAILGGPSHEGGILIVTLVLN